MCACTYVLMCVCVRVCAKRSAIRPNSQLISDLKAWVQKKKNFTVFGAPYQADAQMMYLMKKFRWIQGVIRCVCPCPCSCVYMLCVMLCVYVHVCVFVHMTARTATSGRWGRANGTRVTRHVQGSSTGM